MASTTPNSHPGAHAILLRSVKYDGSLNYVWPARVVWEDAGGFIWRTPAGSDFTRPNGVTPVPYDWVGRVWYDRWYLVDASLVPSDVPGVAGALHHYYCNIAAPGAWEDSVFRFVDLDLDVMIYPDGRQTLLDEDEFAAHQVRFAYSPETIAAVRQAVRAVSELARAGAAPFDGTLTAFHTSAG
jgi:uncharacterized protein